MKGGNRQSILSSWSVSGSRRITFLRVGATAHARVGTRSRNRQARSLLARAAIWALMQRVIGRSPEHLGDGVLRLDLEFLHPSHGIDRDGPDSSQGIRRRSRLMACRAFLCRPVVLDYRNICRNQARVVRAPTFSFGLGQCLAIRWGGSGQGLGDVRVRAWRCWCRDRSGRSWGKGGRPCKLGAPVTCNRIGPGAFLHDLPSQVPGQAMKNLPRQGHVEAGGKVRHLPVSPATWPVTGMDSIGWLCRLTRRDSRGNRSNLCAGGVVGEGGSRLSASASRPTQGYAMIRGRAGQNLYW